MTDKTEQSPSPQDDTRAVLQETLFAHVQTMLAACQTESFALQIPETATHILVGPRARIVEVLGLSAPDDLADTVSKALNRAWSLGQTYWQQADSEFARDHKKADATQEAYWKLVEETRAELARRCCAQREDKDRAYLANQSQAAQPTESINTEEFRKLLFTYTEALFGGSEKEQGKRFAALVAHVHAWHVTHLASQSQATKTGCEGTGKFGDMPCLGCDACPDASQATKAQAEPSEPGPLNTLLQIAEFLDSNSKPQQTGVDTFDYASEFDYNLSHAACTIRSIVADLSEPVASVAKEAPAVPEGFVLMPKSLTAENGAKSLFIGEFKEHITVECPECNGDEECHVCGGDGYIQQDITVEWDTIKNIYALAVEHLAAAPQAPATQEAPVVPDILFDGFSVYAEMDKKAHARTSADNVSDVLDAVVRLIRRATPVTQEAEIGSVQASNAEFKRFHEMLCERFGYTHDERDWKRDQLSLIEFIATQQANVLPPTRGTGSQRDALYTAAINCQHVILEDVVKLYRDHKKPGNALSQLADRLEAEAERRFREGSK